MKALDVLRRLLAGTETSASSLQSIDRKLDALGNQTELLNRLVAGIENHSDLLNRRMEEVLAGVANQSDLLNRQLNRAIEALAASGAACQRLDALLAGVANQSDLLNRKLNELLDAVASPDRPAAPRPPDALQMPPATPAPNLQEAMQQMPLLIADRTYNTSHPEYDARLVRNHPCQMLNDDPQCPNVAFRALRQSARGHESPDESWGPILAEMLEEARSVAHSEQVFERRRFVEQYMAEIGRKYRAHYVPGWVNLDDALFLYWLVRQVKPRTIVQTGVCNGLSASFMILALAKNGPEGTLNVIDLPPVFNPNDPAWTVEGKVYGVVIPEGKTTGWLVPDAYRDRFRVWNGDARELLPKLVDELDAIDFFYHDSDHTYDHMMFEFREAKRKLTPGGLIVGDDISWNASVWDFADQFGVPSYNFKGAVGVAFF